VVPTLEEIRSALRSHEPATSTIPGTREAAVAVVLRRNPHGMPELLLIERARHEGDPWSGQMAFPGGRVDPGDADRRAAAERETLEEVGLSLAHAEPLGRLDDLEPRGIGRNELVISAFVYHLERPGALRPNYEVETALWVPVRELLDPARHVDVAFPPGGASHPGIRVGASQRHVVWGLTLRFLEDFLRIVGRPLPGRRTLPPAGASPLRRA
jgi:8-oxo-dGTP pyrophosphatase MutT (NUDIX family)